MEKNKDNKPNSFEKIDDSKVSFKERSLFESMNEASSFTITEAGDATTEIHIIKNERKRLIKINKKKKKEKVILRFNPSADKGLSSYQVNSRIEDGLINKEKKNNNKSYGRIIFDNTFTFFNILIICVAIALIIARSFNDLFFVLIAFANWLIGVIQECRSKYVVDKLKLVTETKSIVIRDGKEKDIRYNEVVLDDVVLVSSGNQITADCVVLEGLIEMNESLLTGESRPIRKTKGDKIYAGSFVISGSGRVRVDVIGENTFVGKLQTQAKKIDTVNSVLFNGINKIIKTITCILIPLACLLGYINYSNADFGSMNQNVIETIRRTSSAIIGMIPSGMFLLTSVALAVGVMRLAKRKTLVQNIYCIEMLARTNVLCLDKTGTLTDGTMNVDEIKVLDQSVDIDNVLSSYIYSFDDCNATSIAIKNKYNVKGSLVAKETLPFSSSRKLSAVSFNEKETYVFGASEFVCKDIPSEITSFIVEKQKQGLRVLLLALTDENVNSDKFEKTRPIAVITIVDHIREDAYDTIKWFNDNGVEIKIISGDNPYTVSDIARRVGVVDADKYISLEGMNLFEVAKIVNKYKVFGRVTPDQKEVIVSALKENYGKTVAMTGDGVNDILAMKKSDCSIAMANGSDATKSVANLVLLDSNFASMPKVVEEGRRVVNNIQLSSSLYLMKTLFTMALSLLIVILGTCQLNTTYPFSTSNMMILEVFIIGLPSFFLALQPNNKIIKAGFLNNIYRRALSGAITMFVPALIGIILSLTGVINADNPLYVKEMMVTFSIIAVNFGGICMLFKTCYPFNRYRLILFSIMTLLTILLTFLLPSSITDIHINHLDARLWLGDGILVVCQIPFSFVINTFLNATGVSGEESFIKKYFIKKK